MSMIYFLRHLMKHRNSENRFSEFSLLWKTFPLNLFSCLINSFIVNDVCKNLKENVNIKIKSKHIYIKKFETYVGVVLSPGEWEKVNFDAITRFQVYQAQRRNRNIHRRSSVKMMYLKFSQNSQENTCAGASGLQLY